jgi:hypothetical protein
MYIQIHTNQHKFADFSLFLSMFCLACALNNAVTGFDAPSHKARKFQESSDPPQPQQRQSRFNEHTPSASNTSERPHKPTRFSEVPAAGTHAYNAPVGGADIFAMPAPKKTAESGSMGFAMPAPPPKFRAGKPDDRHQPNTALLGLLSPYTDDE